MKACISGQIGVVKVEIYHFGVFQVPTWSKASFLWRVNGNFSLGKI